MSLEKLPLELLFHIEEQAKEGRSYVRKAQIKLEHPPSLQLSWVSRKLRAVFMPRFWGSLRLGGTQELSRAVALLKASPPNTYRSKVKLVEFGAYMSGRGRIAPHYYRQGPLPTAGSESGADRIPIRALSSVSENCGPREGEPWPKPIELFFNDPKRYFKLAVRKHGGEDERQESDETGSEAGSAEEREERACTVCHPVIFENHRHRAKPDDYWLPGAVHAVGPLDWPRRSWGRYRGPDGSGASPYPIASVPEFLQAMTFLMDQLDFEAFRWCPSFPLPHEICQQLLRHSTFSRLGINASGSGADFFSLRQGRDALMLLAPKLTVLEENSGTCVGDEEFEFEYDEEGDDIWLPLDVYSEEGSTRGFLNFLLTAKKLKHLSTSCLGVFSTPCLLGLFARLHSVFWNPDRAVEKDYEWIVAISRLRESLWKLAQAVGKPDYKLETADVQLLAESDGVHSELASKLAPLAVWLAQEDLAWLVAQGWNEQEERGPNDNAVFYPAFVSEEHNWDVDQRDLRDNYEQPWSACRGT